MRSYDRHDVTAAASIMQSSPDGVEAVLRWLDDHGRLRPRRPVGLGRVSLIPGSDDGTSVGAVALDPVAAGQPVTVYSIEHEPPPRELMAGRDHDIDGNIWPDGQTPGV